MTDNRSLFTEHDIYLFKEGSHFRLYEKMGARLFPDGIQFAVWAPGAEYVSVIGYFNNWDRKADPMQLRQDGSGIWECFVNGAKQGDLYKFFIRSAVRHYSVEKGDPFATAWELAPKTASVAWPLDYQWNDDAWMCSRSEINNLKKPFSVYEVHAGSWKKNGPDSLDYRTLAHELAAYVKDIGFTHVEFMPVMEHPFYGSWGYQTGGYFAPTSRFGTPQDFMYLIDHLHQNGIGVILDWVPSHFPTDEYGLGYFDGSHLYEHMDPRQGFHPDWKSAIFNYGRNEVSEFLISNACFWLDRYHVDGLRVDAVASMLYLDYSRKEGEWIPNEYGGRENLEAIRFLRRLNETVYRDFPGIQTIAEESTAWPMVSKPVYMGGLGFGMKWNMGWMHDILNYISEDPVYRKFHHNKLTFSLLYSFSENFMLPFSHDEVVHGKGSLLGKMPGDEWQRFANLRLLLGFMYTHPGKKHLFMGCEIGQVVEWDFNHGLDWDLLQYPLHSGVQKWVRDLNRLYRSEKALYEEDFDSSGFEWIDCSDVEGSIITFVRKCGEVEESLAVICNFTPVPWYNYVIGLPLDGYWSELLNSDSEIYRGSGLGNSGGVQAYAGPSHGFMNHASFTIPPLGIVIFKRKN
jgi:1,4-alpha-glucan branching enzyme